MQIFIACSSRGGRFFGFRPRCRQAGYLLRLQYKCRKESIEGWSDSLLRENFINGKDIPEIAVLPFINVYFAINVQFLYICGYLTVVM